MITHIIIHHTGGTESDKYASTQHHTVETIDRWHKLRWPGFISSLGYYVGYHYVIEADGTVTQTRKDTEEGAHTLGMNRSSIGICLTGNFTRGSKDMITDAQRASLVPLLTDLLKKHKLPIASVVHHRKFASYKDCAGNKYPDSYFQNLLENDDQIVALQQEMIRLMGIVERLMRALIAKLTAARATTLGAVSNRSSLREHKDMKGYSLTTGGIVVAVLGLILSEVLTEGCATEVANVLATLPGAVMAWIGRYRKGDITPLGFKR